MPWKCLTANSGDPQEQDMSTIRDIRAQSSSGESARVCPDLRNPTSVPDRKPSASRERRELPWLDKADLCGTTANTLDCERLMTLSPLLSGARQEGRFSSLPFTVAPVHQCSVHPCTQALASALRQGKEKKKKEASPLARKTRKYVFPDLIVSVKKLVASFQKLLEPRSGFRQVAGCKIHISKPSCNSVCWQWILRH